MTQNTDESDNCGEAVPDGGVVEGQESAGFRPVERLNDRFGSDFVESSQFWLPPFLLVILFVYGAIIWNVLISLTEYSGLSGSPDYSNLDFSMYVKVLTETPLTSSQVLQNSFWQAAINTFVLLIGFTLVTLAIGLGLALLIDRNIRFENTFRTIYLLPMSLSFVVTAQFWAWMYNFQDGIINMLFVAIGVGRIDWLGDQRIVLGAIMFALMWQFAGYAMVVYLAGLRAIPTEHYEAAKVDGASTLKMYWRVIIPQLKGSTISASVVLMVFAMKAFDFLYSLAGGYRPPNGSDILATLMVREAYANNEWAEASAIAIMLFMMALSIVGPYLYYQFKRGNL